MKGIYRIQEDRIDEMKKGSRFMIVKMILIIYAFFVAIILSNNEPDKLFSFVVVSLTFGFTFFLFIAMTFLVQSPVYNSVIEITDKGLIRSGDGLLTVRFDFEEISKVVTKGNGVVLLRRGVSSRVAMLLNKQAYINDFDVLFIPLAITNYDNIVEFINQKMQ